MDLRPILKECLINYNKKISESVSLVFLPHRILFNALDFFIFLPVVFVLYRFATCRFYRSYTQNLFFDE